MEMDSVGVVDLALMGIFRNTGSGMLSDLSNSAIDELCRLRNTGSGMILDISNSSIDECLAAPRLQLQREIFFLTVCAVMLGTLSVYVWSCLLINFIQLIQAERRYHHEHRYKSYAEVGG